MSLLEIDRVHKAYGTGPAAATAVEDVTLTAQPGEMLCIVGPSGCGKTTLLRCVAGLIPPTSGTVTVDGEVVTAPPRSMALVFQDYSRSLLPWMTVHSNVVLPLRARRMPRAERDELAAGALAAVGLHGHGHRHPWQLSAGMQQRVAIARALAYQPRILLLDEPFASVDAQTRADLQDLLLDVWRRTNLTVLLVTHDVDEAAYVADRIVVLSASPALVKETIDVELPRPRDQIRTRQLPEFADLRGRVFASVRAEAGRQSTGDHLDRLDVADESRARRPTASLILPPQKE
ncbi:MAG TPA: ABC transporter ATP-binding protein [Acidimicrobiales bacterium]|nr:ABC transporter ATP-binding protein [Acidimicrobiales bacterium]